MKKRNITAAVAIVIVTLAALSYTTIDFWLRLSDIMTNKTYINLEEKSKHYSEVLESRFDGQLDVLSAVAENISIAGDYSVEALEKFAETAPTGGNVDVAYAADAKGNALFHGNHFNVADTKFFNKAMSGSVSVGSPKISTYSGKKIVSLAVPVYKADAVNAVVFASYDMDKESSLFRDASFYGDSYCFIVDEDGLIIQRSDMANQIWDGENIMELFRESEYKDYSLEMLKNAINNRSSGNFSFTHNGIKNLVGFYPIAMDNWYTFVMVPPSAVRDETEAIGDMTIGLILKMMLIMAVAAVFLIFQRHFHDKSMKEANRKYMTLLANIEGGVVISEPFTDFKCLKLTYVSDGFIKLTGYSQEEMSGLMENPYVTMVDNHDRVRMIEDITAQIAGGDSFQVQYRIIRHDKSLCWVMDTGKINRTDDGKMISQSIITDISQVRNQEEELRLSQERFRLATSLSRGLIFEFDTFSQKYTYLENCNRIYGMSSDAFIKMVNGIEGETVYARMASMVTMLYHKKDFEAVMESYDELLTDGKTMYEARVRQPDGSYLWVQVHLIMVWQDGVPVRTFGHMTDINELKLQNEKLKLQASTDPMTGLYNKTAAINLIEKGLSEYDGGWRALFILDIDNFKNVNDTLGHMFGDAVIIEVAGKLKKLFDEKDVVGRIGGDEFVAFIDGMPNTEEITLKAQQVCDAFRITYAGENTSYMISCSIGVAILHDEQIDFGVLFNRADDALYWSKADGKGCYHVYDGTDIAMHSNRQNEEPIIELRSTNNYSPLVNLRERIFELLYGSVDFSGTINMALSLLGQYHEASRVYIFENTRDNRYTRNSYEWCNDGIEPKMDNFGRVEIHYAHNYLSNFDDNGIFYCPDVSQLRSDTAELMGKYDIHSMLQVAMVEEKRIRGFIGLDYCGEKHNFSNDEIESLVYAAKIIGTFLFKRRINDESYLSNKDKLEALDALPTAVYVIDNEFTIQYVNRSTTKLMPNAEIGGLCYESLMGLDAPCENCPVKDCSDGTVTIDTYNRSNDRWLLMTASHIRWSGVDDMALVSCQDTTKLHGGGVNA